MRRIPLIVIFSLASISTAYSSALFPQRVNVLDQNFEKLGEYRYVYRIFFDLYEAALFTEPGGKAEDVLGANTAFHLQFRYLRTIDKEIILKSADKMLERNLSGEERAAIAQRVKTINKAYTSVADGDTSSLTYKPGTGTTLMINDKPVVSIEGRDFARLYFRIWLGEQSISKSLTENLLGPR